MCELFAMSSSMPTEVSFSLDEFSRHGGLTDLHKDGWGIAYYDQNDARIIKEARSASESAYLRFIKDHSIQSNIVISHIRLATKGEVSVRNTQPFARELAGRLHVFAHNGDLENLDKNLVVHPLKQPCFKPIGNTDSEQAFCYLMENMSLIWNQHEPPEFSKRLDVIRTFANKLIKQGIANFIYSDSEYVFVHSHKRISSKDHKTILPGLHLVCRSCQVDKDNASISGLTLATHPAQQKDNQTKKVALVASVPLSSNDDWQALKEGEIRVLHNGKIII